MHSRPRLAAPRPSGRSSPPPALPHACGSRRLDRSGAGPRRTPQGGRARGPVRGARPTPTPTATGSGTRRPPTAGRPSPATRPPARLPLAAPWLAVSRLAVSRLAAPRLAAPVGRAWAGCSGRLLSADRSSSPAQSSPSAGRSRAGVVRRCRDPSAQRPVPPAVRPGTPRAGRSAVPPRARLTYSLERLGPACRTSRKTSGPPDVRARTPRAGLPYTPEDLGSA